MAEKEYNDSRFAYNENFPDMVDITDIKGESIQISYNSLQKFVGEMFRDRLVAEVKAADMGDDLQFIRTMNLFTRNN